MSTLPDAGGIREVTRRRLFEDLDVLKNEWKILVLDPFTARIISSIAKLPPSDMQVQVQYLPKGRAPLDQEAIYFVMPTMENVGRIVDDFSAGKALYLKAHLIFSSRLVRQMEMMAQLRSCKALMERRGCLKEFNLEYCVVDNRTVTTLQPDVFLRHQVEEDTLKLVISRLSTVFATLACYPNIRYQSDPRCAPGVCRDIAYGVEQAFVRMRDRGIDPPLPREEDCDLLVLDRSFDIAAPFLHPWSYEAMTYEYVPRKANVVETPEMQKSENLELNEEDELWLQLRHRHVLDAHDFVADWHNKYQEKFRKINEGTKEEIAKERNLLSEHGKATAKVKLHKEIIMGQFMISVCNGTKQQYIGLWAAGKCEQEILTGQHPDELKLLNGQTYAEKWSKWRQMDASHRMRLLICWLAAFPQHITPTSKQQWMSRLSLSQAQVDAACRIAGLGAPLGPPSRLGDLHSSLDDVTQRGASRPASKVGAAVRYTPLNSGQPTAQPQLLLERLIRELVSGHLPVDKFPYLKGGATPAARQAPYARPSKFKFKPEKSSRRLIIFVIGGVCREEMRVVHQLSAELGRDIILASTCVATANEFLDQFSKMGA